MEQTIQRPDSAGPFYDWLDHILNSGTDLDDLIFFGEEWYQSER